jgi:hypothetical protein
LENAIDLILMQLSVFSKEVANFLRLLCFGLALSRTRILVDNQQSHEEIFLLEINATKNIVMKNTKR